MIQVTTVLSGVERGKPNYHPKKRSFSVMKFKSYMHLYKIIATYLFISVHLSVSPVKRKLQSNLMYFICIATGYSEILNQSKKYSW